MKYQTILSKSTTHRYALEFVQNNILRAQITALVLISHVYLCTPCHLGKVIFVYM